MGKYSPREAFGYVRLQPCLPATLMSPPRVFSGEALTSSSTFSAGSPARWESAAVIDSDTVDVASFCWGGPFGLQLLLREANMNEIQRLEQHLMHAIVQVTAAAPCFDLRHFPGPETQPAA